MWTIIVPILTLIVGVVIGFFGGIMTFRRQMTKMQNDPQMIQKMAKQMGYNVNKNQMQQVQKMMKNKKWK